MTLVKLSHSGRLWLVIQILVCTRVQYDAVKRGFDQIPISLWCRIIQPVIRGPTLWHLSGRSLAVTLKG